MKPSQAAWSRVLESFAVEHRDHLARLQTLARALTEGTWPASRVAEARRSLHSLKGTSRMLNFALVEQLCHRGETLLLHLEEHPEGAPWVTRLHDALEDAIGAALQGRRSVPAEETFSQLGHWLQLESPDRVPTSVELEGEFDRQVVRVGVNYLDNMLRLSGQIGSIPYEMQDCLKAMARLAPPVLSPMLKTLNRLCQDLEHTSSQFREESRRLLLVPARDILGGLGSQTRELAASDGKQVDFTLEGADTLVELPLLQALMDPLNHLLSNAVHHGLETPAERRAAGKPERGSIRVELLRCREELTVLVGDDGRGLQPEVLKQRAADLGYDPNLPEEELVFLDGLSSQSVADRLAGRGVGMGAVRSRVGALGGRIRLLPGPGTAWELRFLSGAWGMQVLLVRCAERVLALPTRCVRRLRYVTERGLFCRPEGWELLEEGQRLAVLPLARLLGLATVEAPPEIPRLIELETGQGPGRLLLVDEWLGTRMVTLQAVPAGGWPEELLEGAFVSGGRVCLVLNPEYLIHGVSAAAVAAAERPAPLVLVVDDSRTTRHMTTALLNADGYRTLEAADGVEALALLQDRPVDLVVSDIQMPHLDGLGLLERIRADSRVPVVLLTSVTAAEEQRRGMELGADAYLLKQSFDHRELLQTVRRLL